jgi:hypothetical protein
MKGRTSFALCVSRAVVLRIMPFQWTGTALLLASYSTMLNINVSSSTRQYMGR